jgi:hypothetical protein
LALIIAEYQCDVLYRGQMQAVQEFLPLDAENWITCDNALRLDWLALCPPTGTGVKLMSDDLLQTPLDQPEIDFENEGGETYICGNPPYLGSKWQTDEQKADVAAVFGNRTKTSKSLDYVAGWFMKAADYGTHTNAVIAFVATNSICQGQQVPILWPLIFGNGHQIVFAHTSFKWANLASHNAGVTVAIIGISTQPRKLKKLFSEEDGKIVLKCVENINAYLVHGQNIEVHARTTPIADVGLMQFGNHPYYGGALIFPMTEARQILAERPGVSQFIRPLYGSKEFIDASPRACLWVSEDDVNSAYKIPQLRDKIDASASARKAAKKDKTAQKLAETPWRFREQFVGDSHVIIVPRHSSENRNYLPIGLLGPEAIIQDAALAIYDAPIWNLALLVSSLHLVWITTICGKLETRYRYSNTLGWNTFPIPMLTEQNLSRCAEDILLAREGHFPATIADLYDPDSMPEDLRRAHERNDEVLERIYIGRRFRNDTERLEKLFELYTKMTIAETKSTKKITPRARKTAP